MIAEFAGALGMDVRNRGLTTIRIRPLGGRIHFENILPFFDAMN